MQLNNFLLNINRPFAHFGYDSKILSMFLWELFPFYAEESVPFHAKFNEKNEYFPHTLYSVQNVNVVRQLVN